jgi:hypothetical protein
MVLMFSLCLASVKAQGAEVTRVLLLTGANNHDWNQTTPALVKVYQDVGVFAVDVADDAIHPGTVAVLLLDPVAE